MSDSTWSLDKILDTVAMTTTVLAWLAREGLRRSDYAGPARPDRGQDKQ